MLTVTQVSKVAMHHGSIYALAPGGEEGVFFSAGSEGIVVKWNSRAMDQAIAIARVSAQVFALLLLPSENILRMIPGC